MDAVKDSILSERKLTSRQDPLTKISTDGISKPFLRLACTLLCTLMLAWPTFGSDIHDFSTSQLLNHSYLSLFPRENAAALSVGSLNTLDLCNGVVIEEATIDDLQLYLSDGRLTSVQLTTCYIQRVFQVERYIK